MRFAALAVLVACGDQTPARRDAPAPPADAAPDSPRVGMPVPDTKPRAPWSFAVLSDIHFPNPRVKDVKAIVAALVELRVRLVVITGDHTNGNAGDSKRSFADAGWQQLSDVLAPLRKANIAVLPVAGNHDSYMQWQRDLYAEFANLATWAPGLEIRGTGQGHAHAPFSYSVDVDNVHFSLTHIVETKLEPEVATWLAADLASAAKAQHRIVLGHVPLTSVIWATNKVFLAQMGTILERGGATLHVAGHEHLVWDEAIKLPGGSSLRQVLVGCASGFYQYAPNAERKAAAKCTPLADKTRKEPMRCTMPASGGTFEIARGRKNRHVQHARTTFSLFTVNGASIDVQPMMLDAQGRAVSFYLDELGPQLRE